MLALGAWHERPVGRHRHEVGAAQGEVACHLRELEVVADRDPDPPPVDGDDGRAIVTRLEPQLLAIPEMRLAVDGHHAVGGDRGGAVVEVAVGAALGEPADDEPGAAATEVSGPGREHRVVGRDRARPRLVGRLEHVARGGQLGEHHDRRASGDGVRDGRHRRLDVGLQLADAWRQLAARDDGHRRSAAMRASERQRVSGQRLRGLCVAGERNDAHGTSGAGSSFRIWAMTSNSLNSIQSSTMWPSCT